MKDIITIIIPCYNHGFFLEEALGSIKESTKKYYTEVIIVNDGSTDEQTINVLKKVENDGYFVLHQENQGLAKARNNGIKLARGKYILPLDSDNKVCKAYLNEAVEILENDHNIDIVYGNANYFGTKNGIWKNRELNFDYLLYSNHIDACALYRKRVWETNGGYAEDMPIMGLEDWNFWLKSLSNNFTFYFLDKVCFEYCVLENSMIRSVPQDTHEIILKYNIQNLPELYFKAVKRNKEKKDKLDNIFYGGLFRKLTKIALNHFKMYNFNH